MRIPNSALRESISVADWAGSGAHGTTHGAPRTIRAAVQPTSRLVVDARGKEVVAELQVLIRPEAGPVRPESKVTWAGVVYRVLAAVPMPDTRRPSHHELFLTRYAG